MGVQEMEGGSCLFFLLVVDFLQEQMHVLMFQIMFFDDQSVFWDLYVLELYSCNIRIIFFVTFYSLL